MNIQPDFVKEEQLQELSESFRLHNQLPPDLYTRYRIKRGLRNSDGTGVLVGATHLGNVHGYILNEGEREPIEGRLTYRGYNIYDLIHGLEREDRFGFEEIGYLLMCGELPTRRQLEEFQHVIGLERALPDNFTEDMIMRAPSRDIMNKLASATLALYSYDSNPDETTVENIMRQGISLTAKFPVIISHAYQAKRRYFDGASMFLHVPDPERSTTENILHLIRPDGKFKVLVFSDVHAADTLSPRTQPESILWAPCGRTWEHKRCWRSVTSPKAHMTASVQWTVSRT